MLARLTKKFLLLVVLTHATPAAAAISKIVPKDCQRWGIRCRGGRNLVFIINFLWLSISAVMAFAGVITAGALVYFAILYIMSQGDENRAQQAKNGIVYAIVGLLLIGLAAWLVNSIINFYQGQRVLP